VDLVDLHADHGGGARRPGLLEAFATVRPAAHVRDAPVRQDAGEPGVGVVVDHHHLRPAEVELLDGAQPDALETAHNDVAGHAVGHRGIHPRMLPSRLAAEVAAPLNVGAAAPP
jgi:hypothetical protein